MTSSAPAGPGPLADAAVGLSLDERAERRRTLVRRGWDVVMRYCALAGGLSIILSILLLTLVLVYGAWPALRTFGFAFLTTSDWDPVNGVFGVLPALWGTVCSSVIALLLAVPISIGAAVFMVRLAPRWLAGPASFLIELLAAIPSIAYGLWGAAVLVPIMQRHVQPLVKELFGHLPVVGMFFKGPAYGFGMLTAAIILAIMIIPIITSVTRDVLRVVPRELDEGSYALGSTWWQSTRLVLGFSKVGIFGAVMLGLARAVGETMAVTMVIGNSDQLSASILNPAQTMASLLANEFLEADNPLYLHSLVAVALVLLATTLLMNAIARWMIRRAALPVRPGATPAPTDPSLPVVVASDEQIMAKLSAPELQIARNYRLPRNRKVMDRVFKMVTYACALLCIGLLAVIITYITYQGVSGLSLDFFTELPGPSGQPIGMRNCIIGSLILVGMSSVLGIPVGVACGVYLAEYGRRTRLGATVRLLVDVLAGVPSIVVGVVVYVLVVVPMGHFSGIAGSLALALMMVPIIARTTEEMLRLVPDALREASLGAGATFAQTITRVILPAALSGIITGVVLSVARVAGETAPLLFTALGNDGAIYNPLLPFPALPLKIFIYATSADAQWQKQAWAGMLVLILLILVLNVAMRLSTRRRTHS